VTNPSAVDTTPEPTVGRSTRRALLGLGVIGAALAASRPASAGAFPDQSGLAEFVIGAELAARDLYRAAPSDMGADGLAEVLAEHHEAYAERIAGITGISADTPFDQLLSGGMDAFASGDLAAALELENSLAATHAALLAETDDSTLLSALASIVSAESRHAAVLAAESGADLDAVFTNTATAPGA
jgi:hypothetical protein